MKRFFMKPYRWAILFSLLLMGSATFVLLDTFVIPQSIQKVQTKSDTQTEDTTTSQSSVVLTDNSYQDDNIKITIETVQKYNSTIYIADIQVSDASYLKTAFANDTYGRNIKDTTSDIASANNAILAVNGDYYGFRDSGYVLRNGVLYRSTARKTGDDGALVINAAGDFSIIHESQVSAKSLGDDISQILSFGPSLIESGQITVSSTSEVSQSMASNPRTAIGQVSSLHYVIIVSDGRTSKSAGISLLELAQELKDRGCTTAYNLDGGGSSTLYFNGNVINNPTDGKTTGEREVSDIVYFGY